MFWDKLHQYRPMLPLLKINTYRPFFIALLLILGSCGKSAKTIVEWDNVYTYFCVFDNEGNDLLDPSDEQHFVGVDSVVFMEKKYLLTQVSDYLFANLKETQLFLNETSRYKSAGSTERVKTYELVFGPIDGSLEVDDYINVYFHKYRHVVSVRYVCTDHDEESLQCTRKWYYNDKLSAYCLDVIIDEK